MQGMHSFISSTRLSIFRHYFFLYSRGKNHERSNRSENESENMWDCHEIPVVNIWKVLPSSPSSISGGLWCSDVSIPGTPSLSAPAVGPPSSPNNPTGCPWTQQTSRYSIGQKYLLIIYHSHYFNSREFSCNLHDDLSQPWCSGYFCEFVFWRFFFNYFFM